MIQGLLFILGIYAICIMMVHLLYRLRGGGRKRAAHYVLITKNNQAQIEWFIRALSYMSWLKGRTIKITVMDEQSDDDTLRIVNMLAQKRNLQVQLLHSEQQLDDCISAMTNEEVTIIQLSGQDDVRKIPLFL